MRNGPSFVKGKVLNIKSLEWESELQSVKMAWLVHSSRITALAIIVVNVGGTSFLIAVAYLLYTSLSLWRAKKSWETPEAHNKCWMVTGPLKEILRLFELNEFYLQINKIVYTPPYNRGNNKGRTSDGGGSLESKVISYCLSSCCCCPLLRRYPCQWLGVWCVCRAG